MYSLSIEQKTCSDKHIIESSVGIQKLALTKKKQKTQSMELRIPCCFIILLSTGVLYPMHY